MDLTRDAGYIHSFDCGFRGIITYDEIVDSGNEFVTTRHGQLSVETVEDRPLPDSPGDSGYEILRDRTVRIGKGDRRSPHLYRLLEVIDTEGEHKEILTSLLEVPADHICWVKRYHWMVEAYVELGSSHFPKPEGNYYASSDDSHRVGLDGALSSPISAGPILLADQDTA